VHLHELDIRHRDAGALQRQRCRVGRAL
jgi:hypothetical protein